MAQFKSLNTGKYSNISAVWVSGSTVLPLSVYKKKYLPVLEKAREAGAKILVGSAPGCDKHTRDAFSDYDGLIVFVPEKYKDKEHPGDSFTVCVVPGGFKSRDREIAKQASDFVCFFSGYGSLGSGALASYFLFCGMPGYKFVEAMREASLPWQESSQKLITGLEADALEQQMSD